ncbi:MBL fold metallo-hydrolase [Spirillospora sp. NPDC052269]
MRIHHLNCASMVTIEATYEGPEPVSAVAHCLLVETDADGLVLVEAGLGLGNVRDPHGTLDAEWIAMAGPVLDESETAVRQIEALGYDPSDVRNIVLTHLDVDHCGGLPDFPDAAVHVLGAERDAAVAAGAASRYRPAHWAHGPKWVSYDGASDDQWFGFTAIPLDGLPSEIKLIPLGGHSAGHAGVAVQDTDRWLLHCGDAYYYHREMQDVKEPHPLMDMVQTRSQIHPDLRIGTQARLRELVRDHGDEVEVFSAHDPWELARLV